MTDNYFPGFMDRGKYYRRDKPIGGYTNDIFDLEQRQKETEVIVYEDEKTRNENKALIRCRETEDIERRIQTSGRKLRRSLSDCKIKSSEPAARTPPLATGKENFGSHFKNSPMMPTVDTKKLDECIEDEQMSPKSRNPITGEGLESGSEIKLEDTTNIAEKDEDEDNLRGKRQRRPCIRVRQPPGGKSSIVF